ncbi:MAG: efflux RND transporter periplasmic adaptor subunit [Firmicutes bacterium]|nr:efflux RND transporter periplasmic adaptor subunit [Bacillota bacterium]
MEESTKAVEGTEKKGFSRRRLVAAGVIAVLLIAAGVAAFVNTRKDPATVENRPVPVKTAAVQKGSINRQVTLAAKIVPATEVTVIPKVGGRVASVPVDMGDRVQAGQTLLKLESTDYYIAVQQAEAALELNLANQKSAALNLERVKQLHNQGVASQKDLDTAQTAAEQADAQVKQASAALANARNQLGNASINSPIDGIIASRKVDVGEMVNTSSAVFTLVDVSSVYAECSVPETEVGRLTAGQKISVLVSAVSPSPLEGSLSNLAPAADASTKAFPARVRLENPEAKLKPGMFAEVQLATEEHPEALLVPKESIVEMGEQKLVYLVRDGRAVETQVRPGIAKDEMVELLDGVKEGDLVVTVGQTAVKNGSPVQITP